MQRRVRGRTFDRKSIPIVAWYVLSNESYMNRVIKDVFPTVATQISIRVAHCAAPSCGVAYHFAPLETQACVTLALHQRVPAAPHTHLNFFSGFE
jgi:hypothetical protein